MPEKAKTRRERRTCMICLAKYPTGAVLIYRGKEPPEHSEWGLCPPHSKLRDRNLIALVEIDPAKSKELEFDKMMPEDAHRTGTVVYIARPLFNHIFAGEPPLNSVAFVPPEVIAILQRLRQIWGDGSKVH